MLWPSFQNSYSEQKRRGPISSRGKVHNKMSTASPPKSNTKQLQSEVNEVVGIMQDNIHKVMERGEQLDQLQTKTDDLQQSSMQFRRGANRVRRQMWWRDMKVKLLIGGTIIIIIIIIVVAATSGK
eukprot:NODE_100_length_20777_cov_0.240884.p17 type:complete len:126 gc:universal NODE_100_length_20777_cov_0.240884:5662-6039(+)